MNLRLLLLLMCVQLYATAQQSDTLITATFSHAPVEEVVRQLESRTPYRFFFDARQMDSIRVTLSAQGDPLSKVLEQAFRNTVVEQYQVLISRSSPHIETRTGFSHGFDAR